MINYLYRHDKDYSRYNIIKAMLKDYNVSKDIYILLPFSKNQFIKYFLKRDLIVNDFFISNYDTYVYDRKKISKKNPRAWWKYFQDWINFRFSRYLISDTYEHFLYWESLFGKFNGKQFVLPVLADTDIYYPLRKTNNYCGDRVIKIIFYGSFIPLHGIDIILKSFSIMEKKGIDFEATIIGNGQIYSDMKKLFNELDLKKVKMNGEIIAEKHLANEIRKHDIVLGIFGNSKKAKSVIPNKLYQSIACEKCTVTMDSKVLKEFFTDEEIVVCRNTPNDLSDKLIKLINNYSLIEKYSKNGYIKFNKLYEKTKKDFQKFLNEVK